VWVPQSFHTIKCMHIKTLSHNPATIKDQSIHQRSTSLHMSNYPSSSTAVAVPLPPPPPPLTPPPARYLRSGSPPRWRRVASPMSNYNNAAASTTTTASVASTAAAAAHPVWRLRHHDDEATAAAAQRRGAASLRQQQHQQQQLMLERWRVKCPQCQVSQGYQPAESTTFGDVSTRYSHNARVLHQSATCPICLDIVEAPIVVLACGHTICPEHFQCLHGKVGPAAMLSFPETLHRDRQERTRERQERRAAAARTTTASAWQAEAMNRERDDADMAAALGEHGRTLQQQTTTTHLEHVRQLEALLRAHQRQI
jgi:phage FluMu protein Com